MATPAEITYRKAGVEYHEERLAEFGGWDADASDATLGRNDFSEVRNFRRSTTGDLEVRTGIIEHELTSTSTGNSTLLASCEYRADYNGVDTFFDVKLFYSSAGVSLELLLPQLDPSTDQRITVLVDAAATDAESWVQQFAYSLIVTVKGKATYEVAPTNNTLATWTVRLLGKDLGPTPTKIGFVGKTQGDLFVIDNNGTDSTTGRKFADHIKYDPNDPGQPLLIPLNINADYWTVEPYYSQIGTDFSVNDPPRFVFAKEDAGVNTYPTSHKYDLSHNMTRAWGYRFVAVQEFTDSKGDKYHVRSAPGPDFWVADMMYAPAQWGPLGGVAPYDTPSGRRQWWQYRNGYTYSFAQDFFGANFETLPSPKDFSVLQEQLIKRLNPSVERPSYYDPNKEVADPYLWLAFYYGYNAPGNNGDFAGKPPLLLAVPASKLKGAPMTVFTWSQFNKPAAGTVTEIEIYRTTHSQPDDKDNTTKDPNFEVHRYGYVGSLLAPVGAENPTFTDDIVDDAIDFGTTPEQQDGLLRGQFSGSISRDFDNRLVIGDVITDYTVLAPIAFQFKPISFDCTTSCFMLRVDESKVATGYDYTDFIGALPLRFGVAYIDSNGIQSDMTDLGAPVHSDTPNGDPISPRKFWVSINLPRGYAANVTTARIFRGYLNSSGGVDWSPTGANPTAGLIATVKVDSGQGNYLSKNDETAVAGSIVGETKRSINTGAIIFSEPNQINFWPPLNFEVHHQFAPVRMLEVVLGPLYVGTDQSISLTELNGRREELTRRIGPISRHAWQKVDKIVFMLTPYGMYYIESSGVVQFPANVQTAVLPYLQETIAGVLPLTNARRAAIGFIGERNEVLLHLPSSIGIGGTIPHRTIVYKLGAGNNPRETVNYEFDLTQNFERGDLKDSTGNYVKDPFGNFVDDTTRYRPEQVLFQTRAMGGLFAGYYSASSNEIIVVDCDAPVPWIGSAVLEKSWNIGAPSVKKALREMIVRTSGDAKILLSTGQPMGLGAVSHKYGTMHQRARIFPVTNTKPPLHHIISGTVIETTATAPITRIWTEPDVNGEHSLHVNAIDIFAVVLNNHP